MNLCCKKFSLANMWKYSAWVFVITEIANRTRSGYIYHRFLFTMDRLRPKNKCSGYINATILDVRLINHCHPRALCLSIISSPNKAFRTDKSLERPWLVSFERLEIFCANINLKSTGYSCNIIIIWSQHGMMYKSLSINHLRY